MPSGGLVLWQWSRVITTAVIITRWTIRYSLRQRDTIGDMFRRTVGLNVEACDVFLDQVLHKRDAKMLCAFGSQSALGGAVFIAPMLGALAQKVPTAIGILGSPDAPVYPLRASANNRYLVDQNNTPFLMVRDSPQHLITNLSRQEAAAFMGNRRGYGINTLWIIADNKHQDMGRSRGGLTSKIHAVCARH
jgi:hypothetical protein